MGKVENHPHITVQPTDAQRKYQWHHSNAIIYGMNFYETKQVKQWKEKNIYPGKFKFKKTQCGIPKQATA